MGLRINKEHESGAIVSYWNIGAVNFSFDSKVNAINIILRGYLSKKMRDTGKEPLTTERINIKGIKEAALEDEAFYPFLYELVKKNAAWSVAIDDV